MMKEFPEVIKGDDFELVRRRPTFENAKVMFDILNSDRPNFEQWLGWVNGVKSAEDFYDIMKLSEAEGARMYFIMKDGDILGSVGFNKSYDLAKQLHVGYLLRKDATGQGLVHRAMKLLERVAFENGWEIIRIGCDILNEPSKRVAEKLGYVFEGTLRHEEPYPDGRRYDNSFYSKLKSEWLAEQN